VKLGNLSRGEWIAMLGGLLLGISVFVKCYEAQPQNPNATLGHGKGGVCGDHTCSYFQVHPIGRWLLLGAAAAPFILAWIIVRDHALSWPRGEMTAVVSVAAFGLIAYQAFISKPGEPNSLVHLKWGIFIALLGTVLMFVGSALRSSDVERARKPPGTI
jgi:drug/metabolite transporter (DMT)-like permease